MALTVKINPDTVFQASIDELDRIWVTFERLSDEELMVVIFDVKG